MDNITSDYKILRGLSCTEFNNLTVLLFTHLNFKWEESRVA